jgi:peptidylprolyl isomerase
MVIKKGDTVTLDFEGRLEDGEIFDSTYHDDHHHPMTFVCGSGQLIRGFDDAVIGMEKGEEKEIVLKKEEAYGDYKEELKKEVPRNVFPKDLELKEGMVFMMNANGMKIPAKVVNAGKENITLDFNHPLAGKKLIFKIKIDKYNSI